MSLSPSDFCKLTKKHAHCIDDKMTCEPKMHDIDDGEDMIQDTLI